MKIPEQIHVRCRLFFSQQYVPSTPAVQCLRILVLNAYSSLVLATCVSFFVRKRVALNRTFYTKVLRRMSRKPNCRLCECKAVSCLSGILLVSTEYCTFSGQDWKPSKAGVSQRDHVTHPIVIHVN